MTTPTSKIFAVGDIHGCYDKLVELLQRIPLDKENDTIIFLGDYINRGADSAKVIDFLLELRSTCQNAVFLKGNHEQALLEYAASGDAESLHFLRVMGIGSTVESYGTSIARLRELSCFPEEHRDFLHSLKFGVIRGTTIFIHADINETMFKTLREDIPPPSFDPVTETALLSSRRLIFKNNTIPGYTIVFGHIPFASPLVMAERIGIDTGAVYGNMLTALELPSGRFYHA